MGPGAIVRSLAAALLVCMCAAEAQSVNRGFTLPPATAENTIPPNLNRTYFEGAAARPFPVTGSAFSLVRA